MPTRNISVSRLRLALEADLHPGGVLADHSVLQEINASRAAGCFAEDAAVLDELAYTQSTLASLKAAERKAKARTLQRIHAGTYGKCMDCPRTIERKRLKADRFADRCFSCQQLYEAQEVARSSPKQ